MESQCLKAVEFAGKVQATPWEFRVQYEMGTIPDPVNPWELFSRLYWLRHEARVFIRDYRIRVLGMTEAEAERGLYWHYGSDSRDEELSRQFSETVARSRELSWVIAECNPVQGHRRGRGWHIKHFRGPMPWQEFKRLSGVDDETLAKWMRDGYAPDPIRGVPPECTWHRATAFLWIKILRERCLLATDRVFRSSWARPFSTDKAQLN